MTWRLRRHAILLLSTILVGMGLGWSATTRPGYLIETQALDRFFSWRYFVFGAQPIDPRILLVGVDSEALTLIGKPVILWQPDLSSMIKAIKGDHPAILGVDFLISPKTQGLSKNDPFKKRLEDEALQLALACLGTPPVVLVERFARDEFSLDSNGKPGYEDDQVFSPIEVVRDILLKPDGSLPGLGIANVATDPDGSVRRMKIFSWKTPDSPTRTPSNIFLRLLEQGTNLPVHYQTFNSTSGTSSQLEWNGRQAPLFFDETFLLNYPGPTEDSVAPGQPRPKNLTYPIIPASDVLRGTFPAGTFKDKFVILAPLADTLDDIKVVPGDPTYYGAAIHATALNMFLTNSFIYRPTWAWILVTAILAPLGLELGRRGRGVPLALLTVAVPIGYFLLFSLGRLWLPTLCALASLAVGAGTGYIERLLTVERDRARVRSTFARMVSPQVMKHVLSDMESLQRGVRKEVTVLFVDINNFTPTCEQFEPEQIIGMLSEYFSLMVDIILKHDGYLKQYVGDEIMVIYGAPDDRNDHATRAIETALEMRAVLAKAKQQAGDQPGFFDVKIGLNTGPVVVGKVGPDQRWEYAAVGDNVNLGARVMSTAKKLGLDIGVSAATHTRFLYEQATFTPPSDHATIIWTSLGLQTFKGKASQMEIFGISRNGV